MLLVLRSVLGNVDSSDFVETLERVDPELRIVEHREEYLLDEFLLEDVLERNPAEVGV